MRTPTIADVEGTVAACLTPSPRRWLEEAMSKVRLEPAAIQSLFPAVGRQIGRQPLEHPDLDGWTLDDAGRLLLLDACGEGTVREIPDLWRYGDPPERRAILRALPFVDAGSAGGALVRDALRSNDPMLVSAALSPHGVAQLSDEEFAHAVLKCVFVGLPVGAVPGIGTRAPRELARMLADWAHERVAAGRDVPQEIWGLIDLDPPAERLAAIAAELDHPVEARRRAAQVALEQRTAAQKTGRTTT